VDERYQKLTSALGAINEHLGRIYRQLTGNNGDAYLSYTAERRLLFSDGVNVNVRRGPQPQFNSHQSNTADKPSHLLRPVCTFHEHIVNHAHVSMCLTSAVRKTSLECQQHVKIEYHRMCCWKAPLALSA
jgi:hypothetical protein